MYSEETVKVLEGRASVEGTPHWVNTGLDWEGERGILLGYHVCWDRLSVKQAESLISALREKIVAIQVNKH